jgi:hypothetical protein
MSVLLPKTTLYPSDTLYPNDVDILSSSIDYDNASITIYVNDTEATDLYRYSIRDGFSKRELITSNLTDKTPYTDYYIESGVAYKYSSIGNITPILIPNYDGSFLLGVYNGRQVQVNITFNEDLSNFSEVVKDSLVETIGSKYPFIIRQAGIKYKKMNFSGLININMNNGSASLLGGSNYSNFFNTTNTSANSAYNNFASSNGLGYNNNFVEEKLYRENLINFLNDGRPKLLKTSAEGLFLVRLMNLTLSPDKSLGRMIYSFSCELNEIDASSLTNIVKYLV